MVKPLYYCVFLPVTVLVALCTDTKISLKFVCIGNSVEVFRNLTPTFLKSEYTLYKIFGNENKQETIATWVMQNFSAQPNIHPNYSQKVSLENGTILLQDFQASDEAIYGKMLHQDSFKTEKVQLCAHVPPNLRCKPKVKHENNFLIASLDNQEYCGTPSVSVRWMEYPGVVHISKSIIELPPGNDAGTYIACIEDETINCLKNSFLRDKCKNITIGSRRENTSSTISDIPQLTTTPYANDIPQLKTTTSVIVAIVALVLFGVIAILIKLFWKQCELGSKGDQNANRGQTINSQSTRQDNFADPEDGEANQEIVPFVQEGDIELQQMSSVHHQLETYV